MQSFDTESETLSPPERKRQIITVGRAETFLPGHCAPVELPDGVEVAVYNVNGEFYATGNFCPHKGAPLSESKLCGHVIECGLHGWQFDVRSGECLTVPEPVESYRVIIADGWIKVLV
jgi:3-phenylpropionate/trans-cinnamate dioxygenase ferredoxin component